MKIKTFFMSLLLVLGAIQLNSQIDPIGGGSKGDGKKDCASLVNVKQECNEDGTVTISFQIANNSECNARSVTVTTKGGLGQSYNINIGAQSVSNVTITHQGATPGSTICFDIILHGGEGKECCRSQVCMMVDCCDIPGCCDLVAELTNTPCGPNGVAVIQASGGTPGYNGPGWEPVDGTFVIFGLDPGTHSFIITDSEGCKVKVVVEVPRCCRMEAKMTSSECGPDGWATIHVSGGTPPYSGPGLPLAPGYFKVTGLSVGSHTFTYTDSEGCEVDVTVEIEPCCELEASLEGVGCAPNGWVRIYVSGGTPDYNGPGQEIQAVGNFVDTGLNAGDYVYTYSDADGCEVDVSFTIPDSPTASVTSTGGCSPNGTANIVVTGGTPPYTGPGVQPTSGNFTVTGLSTGTQILTYVDSNGCTADVTVTTPSNGMTATANTTPSNCNNNGSATIQISGGAAPYNGPGDNVFGGIFFVDGLAPGDYTYTYFDSNWCGVSVSFTIDFWDGDCGELSTPLHGDFPTPTFWSTTRVSGITATITANFDAWNVHDHLVIKVNNNTIVDETFGTGNPFPQCANLGTWEDTFCVTPCDVIYISVDGSLCPSGPNVDTRWDLLFTCTEGCDGGGSLASVNLDSRSRSDNSRAGSYEGMGFSSPQPGVIQLYPNPVTEVLNISISDSMINYEKARIINSTGNVIHTENISGLNQIEINSGEFPGGMYLIEMTDNSGNRIVEKFMKLD